MGTHRRATADVERMGEAGFSTTWLTRQGVVRFGGSSQRESRMGKERRTRFGMARQAMASHDGSGSGTTRQAW